MEHYQQLKTELLEISAVLERFPESLRQNVYELLVSEYLGKSAKTSHLSAPDFVAQPTKPEGKAKSPVKRRIEKSGSAPSKRSSNGSTPKIDGSLDLHSGGTQSFKEFFAEKKPSANAEFIAVALYYLKHSVSLDPATSHQVFTCFKEVSKKVPVAFSQAFIDAKNRQGYISINEDGTYAINLRGENFVEHELPRLEKKKK